MKSASSVVQKDRRLRWIDHDVGARHSLEEVRPDDAPYRRESIFQSFRQAGYDIVSIDGKPLRTGSPVRTNKAGRRWQPGIEQRRSEVPLPFSEPPHNVSPRTLRQALPPRRVLPQP
jgi:hypothetical protein